MTRLAVLLLGAPALRSGWPLLLGVGLIGIGLATAIVSDAADGVTVVATETFGWIFVIDGLSVIGIVAVQDTRSGSLRLDLARALGLIVLGLLILDLPWENDTANSVLFGLAFLIDGAARIATALVVRFRGWPMVALGGVVELGLAMLVFASWPVSHQNIVPFCAAVMLLLSGSTVLRLALAVRRLPADGSILALPAFSRRCWYTHARGGTLSPPARNAALAPRTEAPPLVIHVWTPRASAADPVRWPLIDRWIAARDRKGLISTGHAALELAPDLYISHYPQMEVERSAADFLNQLRATADNDVPGRFLPSYRYETETWFEADAHVSFIHFDAARLRAHWAAYSRDDTYNLTRRNCSVAVAVAIEAALEGTCGERPPWRHLLRLVASRDFWVAAAVRRRAEAMTWTPGLVLDYARALHRAVDQQRVTRARGWVRGVRSGASGVPRS